MFSFSRFPAIFLLETLDSFLAPSYLTFFRIYEDGILFLSFLITFLTSFISDSLKLQIKKSSQNLHVGDKITLTCIAEGYPNTQLQWFYKDIELYSNDHIIVRDGVLIIRKATYDNSGVYTCRGTHGRDQVNKDESIRILSKRKY